VAQVALIEEGHHEMIWMATVGDRQSVPQTWMISGGDTTNQNLNEMDGEGEMIVVLQGTDLMTEDPEASTIGDPHETASTIEVREDLTAVDHQEDLMIVDQEDSTIGDRQGTGLMTVDHQEALKIVGPEIVTTTEGQGTVSTIEVHQEGASMTEDLQEDSMIEGREEVIETTEDHPEEGTMVVVAGEGMAHLLLLIEMLLILFQNNQKSVRN